MKVLFWGSDHPMSICALKLLLELNMEVVACIGDDKEGKLSTYCKKESLVYYTNQSISEAINSDLVEMVDIGFCYLYHSLIKKQEISLCKKGIINFHPSPLPEHRGIAGCCYAIFEEYSYWGVTAHYIDEKFDTGKIIEVVRFDIDSFSRTGIIIGHMIQGKMYELFIRVINQINQGIIPEAFEQGEADYYSRNRLNRDRKVCATDTIDLLNKKINSFWFPPYHGASITIHNEEFTLVNKKILEEVSELYKIYFELRACNCSLISKYIGDKG